MEASLSDFYSDITVRLEERENSSDNSADNSPSSTNFNTSISSPKRSRRAIQKKVVTVPLKDVESRFKGDCTPPSDSWAWRKYGQKPIKGSPYPRGYYRCSSSKGCPARKQVERSRSDPNMLVVTYSYEHNHPWPTSRSHHQNRHNSSTATTSTSSTAIITTSATASAIMTPNQLTTPTITPIQTHPNIDNSHDNQDIQYQQNMDHSQPLVTPTDELTWLSSDHGILDNNSFFNNCNFNDLDMAKIFQIREEDESLFADLGELPECSVVFRKTATGVEDQQQCNLAPWLGTTG